MKKIILFLFSVIFPIVSFAQDISGKVIDETGQTLPGVNVSVVSTKTSVSTDIDGSFKISANQGDKLQFSFIGYTTMTVAAKSGMVVNMKPSSTELNEVVVIGYGTQKKADITGAITVVSEKDLANRPNTSAISSIQGKVAGVVINNAGNPGGQPSVDIRGIGSISGRNVLYVVDGVLTQDISYLNPNDIEKMSILKDASSSAIYGIRAANGVIVITTKTGKKSGAENIKFAYESSVGFQTPTNVPEFANAADYVQLYNEKLAFEGNTNPADQLSLAQFNGADTNWLDEILRKQSVINTHNLSLNGASEKSTYGLGLGYFTQAGILDAGSGVSSGEDYKRITVRLNNVMRVTDRFRIGGNLAYSKTNSNDATYPFQLARITPSVIPVYNADGSYGTAPTGVALGTAGNNNPRMSLDLFRGKSIGTRTLLSGFAEIDILKSLTFKTSLSRDYNVFSSYVFTPEFNPIGADPNLLIPSRLTKNDGNRDDLLFENTLTFTKEFGKNRVVLLGGGSRQITKSRNSAFRVEDVPFDGSDSTLYLNLGSQGTLLNLFENDNGAMGDEIRLQSYFGRLQYAYDDKYLLNATIRRDGYSSYNFDGNQRSATFPSVGLGWVVSNEGFMNNSGVDFLKFKASWGQLGNATISRQFDELASGLPGAFFGSPSQLNSATSITQLVDSSIEWEVVTGTDFGLELRAFKNRLSVETGYYKKETEDAIFNISNLPTSGLGGLLFTNAGSFVNKGVEFAASWSDKVGEKFSYTVYGNFTTIDNEITEVLGRSFFNTGLGLFGNQIKRYEQGQELGAYYGFVTDGVVQTEAEATALNSRVGAFKFKDLDENGVIDDNDKTFLGSPIPNLTYGFGFNVAYANVDFAADFQGVAGNEIYNFNRNSRFGNENWDQDFVDNRWTPTNPTNSYPAANSDQTSSRPSSFYVEKGDYFRVRNLSLGYSLPTDLLSRAKIDKLRLFVSVQNPFTSFKYNGFSPELGSQSLENLGVDNNAYPLSAIYSFGINLNF